MIEERSALVYDDRTSARFADVRDATRGRLILGGTVAGVVLIIAGVGLSGRNLTLDNPRDLGLIVLVVFFMGIGAFMVILLPMPRHYTIVSGSLGYPRWGGLRRGTLALSEVDAFRLEGRDKSAATIFLRANNRIRLAIPEDMLADPRLFKEILAGAGLREDVPRFRARASRERPG